MMIIKCVHSGHYSVHIYLYSVLVQSFNQCGGNGELLWTQKGGNGNCMYKFKIYCLTNIQKNIVEHNVYSLVPNIPVCIYIEQKWIYIKL